MSDQADLPRLLVIDDLLGRDVPEGTNDQRANVCANYLLEDITRDAASRAGRMKVKQPIAQAVFHRGQQPAGSQTGDTVENDLEGVIKRVEAGWDDSSWFEKRWALVLLDLCFYTGRVTEASQSKKGVGMPEGREGDDDPRRYFGLEILRTLYERFPDLPVVILSSMSREQVSRQFALHGACGFLPREDEDSPELLRDYIQRHALLPDYSGEFIGRSQSVLMALRQARRAALHRRHVLIRGERGAGKELLARYLHRQVPDQGAAIVVVDSGTLSPELYASELFGHRRGAFTGAERDRAGRIEEAHGGEVFLDEIGNMPMNVQTGLLRVLEQRRVIPIGAGAEGKPVDVRFLSATNEDIEQRAALGSGFRQDLLDRLREGGTIFVPPLRERREDIPLLAEKFIQEAEQATPGAIHRDVAADSLQLLCDHDWPGNVRELRTCIFRAVTEHPDVEHLVPSHVELAPYRTDKSFQQQKVVALDRTTGATLPLNEVLDAMQEIDFDALQLDELRGALRPIQDAYAIMIAKCLRAALNATSRPDPEGPGKKILIHPAVKLISADPSVTGSAAADVVKRLLSGSPDALGSLNSDPQLQEALQIARRLRPGGKRPTD